MTRQLMPGAKTSPPNLLYNAFADLPVAGRMPAGRSAIPAPSGMPEPHSTRPSGPPAISLQASGGMALTFRPTRASLTNMVCPRFRSRWRLRAGWTEQDLWIGGRVLRTGPHLRASRPQIHRPHHHWLISLREGRLSGRKETSHHR